MPKTIAITQSNYIPWKGYFDVIHSVDELVLFDDVQFTKGDWRNRNRIKTQGGLKWLTVPVEVKGKYTQKIKDTLISDPRWARKHWEAIRHSYSKAVFFKDYRELFEELYLTCNEEFLSRVNFKFLEAINRALGIKTPIRWSHDFKLPEEKNERLISICRQAGATKYISGPAAKEYLDESIFRQEGIEVEWMDYSNYPEYRQLFPPFEHGVTILDLLFNEGSSAKTFMKSF
ncbi:MAG: WbqC family protein [Nitrospinae bacterium]|nr:WbqC family protein [Nitrospinota bacterium]